MRLWVPQSRRKWSRTPCIYSGSREGQTALKKVQWEGWEVQLELKMMIRLKVPRKDSFLCASASYPLNWVTCIAPLTWSQRNKGICSELIKLLVTVMVIYQATPELTALFFYPKMVNVCIFTCIIIVIWCTQYIIEIMQLITANYIHSILATKYFTFIHTCRRSVSRNRKKPATKETTGRFRLKVRSVCESFTWWSGGLWRKWCAAQADMLSRSFGRSQGWMDEE